MDDHQILQELKKIDVELDDDHLKFKPHRSSKLVTIPINQIQNISIDRAKASLSDKFLFWGQRYLFFDTNWAFSPFDDVTDYRYCYDFLVELSDSTKVYTRVKDFNLLRVDKAIKILLEKIQNTTHNSD
jgi:hypothetical protein